MGRCNRQVISMFILLFSAIVFLIGSKGDAEVRLPHILGDKMVLQRDMPVPIWGWAEPGEEIAVKFGKHEIKTKADAAGNWIVKLPAMEAGGPYVMKVTGKNTILLTDILVGEVWICSGQSNMAMGVGGSSSASEAIPAAEYPKIRFFKVPNRISVLPVSDVNGVWRKCSPATVRPFSAVGYFFGRELHEQLDVPVGLINTSWGGSRIEPWTPPAGFASVPKLEEISKMIEMAGPNYEAAVSKAVDDIEVWLPTAKKALAEGESVPAPPFWPRHQLDGLGQPTALYNSMIHPLVPFGIRGAIWYQGESNHSEGMMYFEKMKALINGWRAVWGEGDFPFYFVQLAPFRYGGSPLQLPLLWEAQTAALSLPNTGMAVINDIGNLIDIHPRNKEDVGKRLALWALARTYGREDVVYSGPMYKSMAVEEGRISIGFDHVGGGLVSRHGGPLTWFEIAGEDKKFVKAEARIDGDKVIVWNDTVSNPVAVRFGWYREAVPNLMNKEGLPARSFRTDRWEIPVD